MMMKIQRYHIGEQVSDHTIQPKGEPIPSDNGWWYAVDEADQEIQKLILERDQLKSIVCQTANCKGVYGMLEMAAAVDRAAKFLEPC